MQDEWLIGLIVDLLAPAELLQAGRPRDPGSCGEVDF